MTKPLSYWLSADGFGEAVLAMTAANEAPSDESLVMMLQIDKAGWGGLRHRFGAEDGPNILLKPRKTATGTRYTVVELYRGPEVDTEIEFVTMEGTKALYLGFLKDFDEP